MFRPKRGHGWQSQSRWLVLFHFQRGVPCQRLVDARDRAARDTAPIIPVLLDNYCTYKYVLQYESMYCTRVHCTVSFAMLSCTGTRVPVLQYRYMNCNMSGFYLLSTRVQYVHVYVHESHATIALHVYVHVDLPE